MTTYMTNENLDMMHDRRHDPYGLVGTKMSTSDAREAMRLADLDWTVETVTVMADLAPQPKVINNAYATVRTDPTGTQTPLAVVGNQYHPLQNETVFDLLQNVVDDSGATFTAAGHTHGGRRTFAKMALPQGLMVGGMDPLETSIVAFNSHDGSGMLTLVPTTIRLACTNQFPALRNSAVKFKARHTTGALSVGLDQIRRSLNVMFTAIHEVEEIGNELASRPFSDAEFDAFLLSLDAKADPTLPKDLQLKSSITRADQMRAVFRNAPNLEQVRHTEWAALQAVIEVMDWNAKGNKAERMVVRSPSSEAVKTRALGLLLPAAV